MNLFPLDPISQVLMRFLLEINHQESPQENNHFNLSYNNTTDALKGNIHLNNISSIYMWAYTGENVFSSSPSNFFPGVISHMVLKGGVQGF
jgi:hypothetical protein